LYNLAHTSQPKRAHSKGKLQNLASRCFQNPIECEGNEEECNKVQYFVRLLVRWNCVIGRGEAGSGGDEDESDKGACKAYQYVNSYVSCIIVSAQCPEESQAATYRSLPDSIAMTQLVRR
jgi:hypothetical protein